MDNKIDNIQLKKLLFLIQNHQELKNKDDIFDFICRISEEAKKLKEQELREASYRNEFYIDIISECFNNQEFLNNLKNYLLLDHNLKNDSSKHIECKQNIRAFLNLSFFMVSVLTPVLKKENFLFISQFFSSSIKYIYSQLFNEIPNLKLKHLFYSLQYINSEDSYSFKRNIPKRFDSDYLKEILTFSRLFINDLLVNKLSLWVIPKTFKEINDKKEHTSDLFSLVSYIIKGKEYHKQILDSSYLSNFLERKDLEKILSYFINGNIEDVIFLINELWFDSREEYINNSRTRKINLALEIKEKVQNRFQKLSVFGGDSSFSSWSNKVFLVTIRFLSVLDSIKNASDNVWKAKTFDYFFNQWLKDADCIINHDEIIEEIRKEDPIVIYVEGMSDKIILENAYKKFYPGNNRFIFYETGGKKELFKKINAVQISDFEKISFGIFDFDNAYSDFFGLKNFGDIQGDEASCLYRVREDGGNKIFALLLPVPDCRNSFANREFAESSMLHIELLFNDAVLKQTNNFKLKKIAGGIEMSSFSGDKTDFANKTSMFRKEDFICFKPLFLKIFELANIN